MKLAHNLLALAVLAGISSTASADIPLDVIGGSEISFQGLVQADVDWYGSAGSYLNASKTNGLDSDQSIRRAELIFVGKGPAQWGWVVGYDAFANKWLDTNINYKFGTYTTLYVGQFKQPNSMEELSSTRFNDFISKAMGTNLQAVARRVGVGGTTGGANWTLTGSWFTRELTRNLGEGNGFGMRGTWSPINDVGSILHFGGSYVSYASKGPNGDGQSLFRVRPDADLSNRLIFSPQFTDGDNVSTWGGEVAWVHGPIKLMGEWMDSTMTRNFNNPDYNFNSYYLSGVWNVSGETWTYKSGNLATNLPDDPSAGMWQLGVRYDNADLNSGLVTGGQEDNWTLGVNYYWRSNFKFAVNYVMVNSEKAANTLSPIVERNPNITEFRAQIYW